MGKSFSVLVALVLLVPACSQRPAEETETIPEGATVVQGAGATFPAILYENWFAEFNKENPDIYVKYKAIGSGAGTKLFMGDEKAIEEFGEVDFGASDAALTDKQLDTAPDGARLVPMTAGAIVLAYNLPDFEGNLRLSRDTYEGIFLGKITKWNDTAIVEDNPGVTLPNITIYIVARSDSSGTTFAFTNHLAAISPLWKEKYGARKYVQFPGNVMRGYGNGGVAGLISQSPGAIGYVQYGFAKEIGLEFVELENRAGRFVSPSIKSFQAAIEGETMPANLRLFMPDPQDPRAYPIVTFSWILLHETYNNAEKADAMKKLFTWCLKKGQGRAEDYGYVPLPQPVVEKSLAALESVKAE